MSKKHFIQLADMIREHNKTCTRGHGYEFEQWHIDTLAEFCRRQNYNFKQDRWLSYIKGECGPNGGAISR